jgi:hypothetical protein
MLRRENPPILVTVRTVERDLTAIRSVFLSERPGRNRRAASRALAGPETAEEGRFATV